MKIRIITPLILLALYSCKNKSTDKTDEIADFAITNVTLIDGTGEEPEINATVLIKDDRILKIVKGSVEVRADSIIDGTSKYVIPGLFDNHIHLGYDETKFQRQMDQLIHFGITTILVPGANNQKLLQYKSEVKEMNLQAPNIYHTSLMTTMRGKHPAKTYGDSLYVAGVNINYIEDESSVDSIVNQAIEDEAIAVKLMIEDGPQPPFVERIPEEYITLISEKAHQAGLDFFAHISDMEEVTIAVNNQADALMHFAGVRVDWENDTTTIQKIVENDVSWVSTAMIGKSFLFPMNKQWLENKHYAVYDEDQKEDFKDPDGSKEAEARATMKMFTGTENPSMEMVIFPMMQDLKKLYDKGVNIVIGTDVRGRPYIFPGFSVHEEIEMFQMGGFKAEQIIQCASLNAAKMLKVDRDYGSVEPGKYADLVLLDQNPLEDITNTLSINTVFKQGRIMNRISSTSQ